MRGKNPLDGTRPAAAPLELRTKILAAIRDVSPTPSEDRWEYVWNSRRLRFAWLLTVLTLLALNLLPNRFPREGGVTEARSVSVFWQAATIETLELSDPVASRSLYLRPSPSVRDRLALIYELEGSQ